MFLKKIVLRNFRSHEKTVIDLEPGINAIVGPSGSGKSSVLRALQWALFNEPKGTDFITWGKNRCSVKLVFEDGLEVTRFRSSTENFYKMRLPDADRPTVFLNLPPKGPPKPVQEALNMGPINVRWQHDGPFFISDPPGETSKKFSELVNAELADALQKIFNQRAWKYRAEIRTAEEQIEKAKSVLSKEQKAQDAVDKAEAAYELQREIVQLKTKKLRTLSLIREARSLFNVLSRESLVKNLADKIKQAEELSASLDQDIKKKTALSNALRDARALMMLIEDLKRKIAEAEREFQESFPNVCPLCGSVVSKRRRKAG